MKPSTILKAKDIEKDVHSKIVSMSFNQLAEFATELDSDIIARDKQVKILKKVRDFLTESVVPDKLDAEGMVNTTVVLKSGEKRRWQTSEQAKCSIIAKHRADMYKWLESNGHGSLITDTVNSSTFKAFVLEQKKKGNQIPEDFISLYMYSKASLVKA